MLFIRVKFKRKKKCFRLLTPAAHLRKVLSKIPREAVSSAVSSSVRWSFCEFFASRGREANICCVWYFLPRETNSASCAGVARIWLSQINRLANKIAVRHVEYRAWNHVSSPGNFTFLVAEGCIWLSGVVYSCIWLYRAVYGCILLYVVVYGDIGLYMVDYMPNRHVSTLCVPIHHVPTPGWLFTTTHTALRSWLWAFIRQR